MITQIITKAMLVFSLAGIIEITLGVTSRVLYKILEKKYDATPNYPTRITDKIIKIICKLCEEIEWYSYLASRITYFSVIIFFSIFYIVAGSIKIISIF